MLQIRHGDVGLMPVAAIPAGAIEITATATIDGRVILAEGEATGHVHALVVPARARRFERAMPGMADAEVARRAAIADVIPTLPTTEAPVRVWQLGDTTYVAIPSPRVLEHEEHGPQVIPRGAYRVLRQREYEFGGERRVVD